jgi:MFS family permease
VCLYLGTWACVGFGYTGFHAVLFNLYLLRLGYGPEFVGTANSTLGLVLALFSLPAGWLGRRYGCRPMLMAGMALSVVYALVPASYNLPLQTRSLAILLAVALFGIAAALVMVNSQPFLMANAAPEHRNRAFSMQAAITPLFAFGGSLVAGMLPWLLSGRWSLPPGGPRAYGISLLVTPLLLALGFLAVLFTREVEDVTPRKKRPGGTDRPPLRIIMTLSLVNLLFMGSVRSTHLFFNVYMDTALLAPTFVIGAAAATAQLISVPSALLMPFLARKIGRSETLVLAVGILILSQLFLAFVPRWAAAGLSFAGVTVAFAVFRCAFAVHSQELVAGEWRSIMVGTVTAARGISTFAIVFGGGYLISGVGHRPLFILNALLAVIAGAVFFLSDNLWPARERNRTDHPSV